jgi:uncharacterized protein (TIGR00369 family)
VPQPPICAALGFALFAAEEGVARFRGQPAEYQYNPTGQVHGGWASTLLDSAMGSAVMTTVYLTRAIDATTGPVVAEGRVIHRGGRVVTAEGRLTDERSRLLAHATTSCLLLPR